MIRRIRPHAPLPTQPCRTRRALAVGLVLGLALWAGPSLARGGKGGRKASFCSATANLQLAACETEASDDFLTAQAICLNQRDEEERDDCYDEAKQESSEARDLCREQRAARRELCAALGEERYDPDFDPADFDDDFSSLSHPNDYFPLSIGNRWEYAGGDETIHIEVLDATKSIEGVTCIVVNDRVEEDGAVVEDTDDWFGQRKDGTVDYCGEVSRNFELFEGDDPELPELTDLDGSWKAGRDGAKAGTLFPGAPEEGMFYRQEWAPGDAEDVATVLSTSFGPGSDPELHELVPPGLTALFCAAQDCVVTGELTAISPGDFERKYYARGIGLFLEVNPEAGETVELVGCNFDPKCAGL